MHLMVLQYQQSEEVCRVKTTVGEAVFSQGPIYACLIFVGVGRKKKKKIKAALDTFQHVWIFSADIFPPFRVEVKARGKINLYCLL